MNLLSLIQRIRTVVPSTETSLLEGIRDYERSLVAAPACFIPLIKVLRMHIPIEDVEWKKQVFLLYEEMF